MDLTNLKMAQGEPQWAPKHNGLVDAVQKVVGVTDQLHWTEFTKAGLVFPSGVECTSGGYTYTQIGTRKLVLLSVTVKITSSFKGIAFRNVVTLPDVIVSPTPYISWGAGSTEIHVEGNEIWLGDTAGNNDRQWQGDWGHLITVLYVA